MENKKRLIKFGKYVLRYLPIKFQALLQSFLLGGDLRRGARSYLHPSVHLLGRKNILIGVNSCVSEGTWINVNHRMVTGVSLKIGDNCFIGKNNFFTTGSVINVGDYTLTTIGCKFIGSSHVLNDPEIPYICSGTTNSDCIEIGVNCFFGADSMIMGNVTIGHGSVIGANSFVLQDVPPFSMVIGNPGRVVKRFSFLKMIWIPISEFTDEDLNSLPSEKSYLIKMKSKYPSVSMPWLAAGRSMGNL